MYTKGVTLIEILIVVGVIATLAGIGFALAGPAREKGRQSVCIAQVRQIYAAHAGYASDWDCGGQFPELHGLCYLPKGSKTLRQYGVTDSVLYCPSLPEQFKSRFASSYILALSGAATNPDGTQSLTRNLAIRAEERHGLMAPVLDCTIHDELFYAPSEANIAAAEASPFVIRACLDGSVHAKRFRMPRSPILTPMEGTR